MSGVVESEKDSSSIQTESQNNNIVMSDSESSTDIDMVIDHFGEQSLHTMSDIGEAIEACKRAVLQTEGNSDSRKDLVQKIIKLRIRYFDLKEREEFPIKGIHTHGHVFIHYQDGSVPGVFNSRKIYCQQCGYNIWIYLQSSQHCRECGFSVHSTCMDQIMRDCVAIKVKTEPDFILDICPEKCLPRLKYRCVECDQKLSWNDPAREPRLCDYTGLWFCPSCHWNGTAVTPARVVLDWDFEPRAVSQATKQYLFLMAQKPVLNLYEINPKLYAAAQDLVQVQDMREKIILMKKYLMVCRLAMDERLLLLLSGRQHFVDDASHYSMTDLMEIKSEVLPAFLKSILEQFSQHIKTCILCTAKSFICELCDTAEVLYPFDDLASSCGQCKAVFHRACFRQSLHCPKCERMKTRSRTTSLSIE